MKSNAELIAYALAEDDEDHARWDFVHELQMRGNIDVLDAARALLAHEEARHRQLGVDILAQGRAAKTLREHVLPRLHDLAEREQDPHVIASLCSAFGHLQDPDAIDFAIGWAGRGDEDVRYGVVRALSGWDDERAIRTLIYWPALTRLARTWDEGQSLTSAFSTIVEAVDAYRAERA